MLLGLLSCEYRLPIQAEQISLLISEVSFNNLGKKDGIWKVWNDNGELSAIIIYDSGNRIGNWKSLDKDGQIAQTLNY